MSIEDFGAQVYYRMPDDLKIAFVKDMLEWIKVLVDEEKKAIPDLLEIFEKPNPVSWEYNEWLTYHKLYTYIRNCHPELNLPA